MRTTMMALFPTHAPLVEDRSPERGFLDRTLTVGQLA